MRTRYFQRTLAAAVLCLGAASLLLAATMAAAHAHGDHADDSLSTVCSVCTTAKILPAPAATATAREPQWLPLGAAPLTPAPLTAAHVRASFEPRAPPRFRVDPR